MRRRPRWKFSILSVILGCALVLPDTGAASSCSTAGTQANQQSAKRMRLATFCLLNRARRAQGLPRLKVDPRLRLAARRHAADMVARRYFAHVSLAGRAPADRIRAAGYLGGASRWYVGENLTWGAGRYSTPRDRVEALMHSPPHRQNMLQTRYQEVGIWVAPRAPVAAAYPSGATYVINFGTAG